MRNLEKEIKELKRRGPNNSLPPSKMAKITAAALNQSVTQAAFKLFHNRKFRRLAKLDKLEKIEQDRIFNELVLAAIILIMLTLEAPDLRNPRELKDYFLLVQEQMSPAHIAQLRDYGVERKYLKLWKKLIKMRLFSATHDLLDFFRLNDFKKSLLFFVHF